MAAHNDRMAAAYQHLAERAQALELPGAATLLARGPPRARAASAPASAAAAAAAASEPASSRTLAEAPLFRNGDRVRVVAGVVAGGHTAVHHLATGLRVPAKLVGDATRLGGGGGGASGGTSGGGASAGGGSDYRGGEEGPVADFTPQISSASKAMVERRSELEAVRRHAHPQFPSHTRNGPPRPLCCSRWIAHRAIVHESQAAGLALLCTATYSHSASHR